MKIFLVDNENGITVLGSLKEAALRKLEGESFKSSEEFRTLVEKWPNKRLVEVWNALPGVKQVQRFASRSAALRRVWTTIQHLQPLDPAPLRTRSKDVKGKQGCANPTRHMAPPNKATLVVGMLQSSRGASLQQIMHATGWQAHTVRGFVSAYLKKKLGLTVRSFVRDGERVYAIKG
jgi:hypothetical protein